jgi:flagellar protein FliS
MAVTTEGRSVIDAVADHYLVEKVNAAGPAELIALLYDKAVLSLKRAQQFLAAGDKDRAYGRIVNASDVVLELRCVLNPAAGDMTVRLEALYAWVTSRLLVAASRHDSTAVQDALDVLQPLQSAWRQACVGTGTSPTVPAAVPAPR